jgi:biopolymer transport protein ExbD
MTRQTKRPETPKLNMASMIDVVFLLLIFFLTTSSFSPVEKDLSAQLPQKGQGTEAESEDIDTVRIRINSADTSVLLTIDDVPIEGFTQLYEQLKARRQIADLPVVIEGKDHVPFDFMAKALDACHRANLRRVAYSATQGK